MFKEPYVLQNRKRIFQNFRFIYIYIYICIYIYIYAEIKAALCRLLRLEREIRREATHKERTCNMDLLTSGSYVIQISHSYLYKLYIIVFIIFMHEVIDKVISL